MSVATCPPADMVNSLLDKLNYSPMTQGGQVATDMATKPFQMLGEIGKRLAEPAADNGYTALATATNTGVQKQYHSLIHLRLQVAFVRQYWLLLLKQGIHYQPLVQLVFFQFHLGFEMAWLPYQ